MIGYVTRLIFFTFLDFDHLQGVTEVAGTGGGVKVEPKKQTLVSRFRKDYSNTVCFC